MRCFCLRASSAAEKGLPRKLRVFPRTGGCGAAGAAWRHVTMDSGAFPLKSKYPVAIVGAGPVGLTAALALSYYQIPFVVFEANAGLSTETKAGTTLIRTLEVWQRFGAADRILSKAMRVDEIGDIERATNRKRDAVKLHLLRDETRFPFVINLPQSDMEPALRDSLAGSKYGKVHHRHRLTGFTQHTDHVTLELDTPDGKKSFDASFLLACDGGRSTVRERLGVSVEGRSLPERFALVDLKVDLDVENPRDFPYLGYFSDAKEWMILVRQPECWRFLYPVFEGQREFTDDELREKAMAFIGGAKNAELVGTNLFKIYHRVASKWHHGRVVLLGDAAHLITPMWALGLNTGILDANNLAWRIAWIMRGWGTETLLDAFESEQKPVAEQGSGEMAEAGRAYMASRIADVKAMSGHAWGNAYTRSLLGVRLGLNGTGDWSMVKPFAEPPPVVVGDRAPDGVVHDSAGHEIRLHDLFGSSFVALYFTDVRRRPDIPAKDLPWLRHYAISRWDAPRDSAIRSRALLDSGNRVTQRYGCEPETMVLVRPDDHVAAIAPMTSSRADAAYQTALKPLQRQAVPA
jgi:3-(3-hydroxy-phenyl)propionate hydroxylase